MSTSPLPKIGKDVIESLTAGMYEDCRFIYREYVQNAADQIDKAVKTGLISKEDAGIHITIDQKNRSIVIEDNATGIRGSEMAEILRNIAQSTKVRGVDKGFRGIGRLGGLAYCDRLKFETSFKGEAIKSTLNWDAAALKRFINNREQKEDAAYVIDAVTKYDSTDEDSEAHYFKVVMENVNNDELLDKNNIEEYLSMVAPVPFGTNFIFRHKLAEDCKKHSFKMDEYKIYLNSEQIFKSYSTHIKKDESRAPYDEVIDVEFFFEPHSDGTPLLWGWHSISEKNQSMNEVNIARGFRVRKANIQVGDEYTLLKLHKDRRFQFYYFGEIHGLHPDLIPNSRRDNFIENSTNLEFEKKVSSFFHTTINKLSRTASEINTFIKRSEDLQNFEEEFKQKQEVGFIDSKEQLEFVAEFEEKKKLAIKAKKQLEKIEKESDQSIAAPMTKIINRAIKKETRESLENIESPLINRKPKFRTDNLSALNKEQRKFLGRIYSIIRNALDADTAKNLIQKIEEELK